MAGLPQKQVVIICTYLCFQSYKLSNDRSAGVTIEVGVLDPEADELHAKVSFVNLVGISQAINLKKTCVLPFHILSVFSSKMKFDLSTMIHLKT